MSDQSFRTPFVFGQSSSQCNTYLVKTPFVFGQSSPQRTDFDFAPRFEPLFLEEVEPAQVQPTQAQLEQVQSALQAFSTVVPLVSLVAPVVPTMAQPGPPKNMPFVAFNQGSPLNIVQHHGIPLAVLRSLPHLTGEDHTTPIEHIRDVASLCGLHQVAKQDVVLKLLAVLLKG